MTTTVLPTAWILLLFLRSTVSFTVRPSLSSPDPKTTSLSASSVDVVLFGIGDLRVDDHVGLSRALQDGDSSILPVFCLTNSMIQNLPGAVAHGTDTAKLVHAAVQDLRRTLDAQFGLPLFETDSLEWLQSVDGTIHVCDLGGVDNRMGYSGFSYVQDLEDVLPWNQNLRQKSWASTNLPSDFPTYQSQYCQYAALEPKSIAKDRSAGKRVVTMDGLSTKGGTLQELQERFETLCGSSSKDANTGLYGTHWGGLDAKTVGCTAVSRVLEAYANNVWEPPKVQTNPLSLEHATMTWQGASNWQSDEPITRFLAAPLFLGTVSQRRVWHQTPDDSWWAPNSLRRTIEGQEWHRLLAKSDATYQYWRYHGYLCRYAKTNFNTKSDEGILLVHGFGASGAQWNKAMQELKETGVQFSHGLAPDMLGFGQSEKPGLSYSGYLWDAFLLDFVREIGVYRLGWEKYVTGGNSIGGFSSMSLAASDLARDGELSSTGGAGTGRCSGLVLMNSAGNIVTREELQDDTLSIAEKTAKNDLEPCSPPPRPVARVFGNAILSYLRPSIQGICKNLYPTNPEAVDNDLCDSIERDSLDPGAIYVMMAGTKLPPPRTANELLKADFGGPNSGECTFDGPVLVAQGVLDPLNDAQDRMEKLGALRDGITMSPIQAGHCPHDELPGEVAQRIAAWAPTRASAPKVLTPASIATSD